MRIKLIGLNARFTHSCLALFYLRNELEKKLEDPQVEIIQSTINDSYYELLLKLAQGEPDYCFYSAYVWNSDIVVKLIRDQNRFLPNKCRAVVGGPQAEVVGRLVGDGGCSVVVGEIERVDRGFFKDLSIGELKAKYQMKRREINFDFPYRPSDFHDHLKNRHIYYETSRGCPYKCTYCLSSVQRSIFYKNIETVKSELSSFLTFNPGVVRFVDRTFNGNPQRALEIWKFLASQDCDTVFHFEISPDRFTEEMFAFLADLPNGKFQFEIGIQSTHVNTLKAVNRPMDVRKAGETITRLSDFENIHLHVDLILGLPHETKSTFLHSLKDVFSMRPHYIQMGLLKILPDTPISHQAADYQYRYSGVPPYAILSNSWMDHETLQYLYWYGECVERFLNNRYFVSFWQYLRRSSVDIVAFFAALVKDCHFKLFFQRAATQELMCLLILECVEGWKDKPLIFELLRYDWLRCGHRFLPECLKTDGGELGRTQKKELFQNLSRSILNGFTKEELSHSFRKGFFLEFSHETVSYLALSDKKIDKKGHHYLCFLSVRDKTLHNFVKVVYWNLSP